MNTDSRWRQPLYIFYAYIAPQNMWRLKFGNPKQSTGRHLFISVQLLHSKQCWKNIYIYLVT